MITDEKRIDEVLARGVENIFIKEELRKKLLSGKKIRLYLGIDPTGADLHLGHVIPLWKLKDFQDLGHEVILLIGDFTARIGDPSGKDTARRPLSGKEIEENILGPIVPGKAGSLPGASVARRLQRKCHRRAR